MKKLIPLSIVLLTALSASNYAHSASVSAAEGWNNSAGWQSAYEKLVKDERADKIKKAKSGYYDGFETYNYYISSTTVGNLVTISDSTLDGVTVRNLNCGNVTSQNLLSGEGSNVIKVNSDTC